LIVSKSRINEDDEEAQNRLECRTCPYQYFLKKTMYERIDMPKKVVEDVMGGKDAWENVDKIPGMCLWGCATQ
jgi:DNA-directed RNA polymerase III subunit RPC11